MKNVYVIVVTYNGIKWIEECLTSLNKSSLANSIIVVDNNSNDNTVDFVKSEFPNVILLEQKENLGFGKANNIGMMFALKQNADFIFLLNQDAFVDENTIESLVYASQDNPEYDVLSPIQLDYSGSLLEHYFFKFMVEESFNNFFSDFILKNDLKSVYDVHYIQAAAWFLPINTINKIGGFDPIFYHYGEDNNYCQRLLYHNMKIGISPNIFIRHDSHKPKTDHTQLFSKKYYDNYLRVVYFKYADINRNFGKQEIRNEIKKNYILILKSLVKFNLGKVFGYCKQTLLFQKNIKVIMVSRARNKVIHLNHLQSE